MGDGMKDDRFSHIAKDPRFKSIPRSQRQVKIDKRFQGMFKDERFKIKYSVDKRGRPVSRTSNEDLERYYALSSGSSDSEEDEAETDKGQSSKKSKKHEAQRRNEESSPDSEASDDSTPEKKVALTDGDSDSESEIRSDDNEITEKIKSKLHDMSVDYARGEGAIISDSSSDEESSDEADVTVEHEWGELDKEAGKTDEITSRLAVCNMDWDRIRAVDLMVLLNSFTPPGGVIQRITIYPSEFGLERMKKEELEGPSELVAKNSKSRKSNNVHVDNGVDGDSEDDTEKESESSSESNVEENEEGSSYHMEKLRKYQLNRLKYFYAVVECDSANTANHIYTECDGMEYESSATRLDLRFVPEDTTFDQEPRETCTKMPDSTKYRPRHFTTTALQQAKVELTWDETDPTRTEIASRLLSGDSVDDKDLQAYLASSSGGEETSDEEGKPAKQGAKSSVSKEIDRNDGIANDSDEEDDVDEDPIAKYRSLLSGIEEEEREKKNKDVHMEISWGLGLKEKAEEAVKQRISNAKELTPFQQMMEKRKQKRLEKKKEKLAKKMQNGDTNESLLSDDDIPSDIDMNDPYFAEEFKDFKAENKKKKGKKMEKSGEDDEGQQRKAELELLLLDKDEAKHFNFKKIQEEEGGLESKRKKKAKQKKLRKGLQVDAADDDFKVNVDDNRFSALYSSHHYNIDPTDPHFRKTHGMEALISAKQKRLVNPNYQNSSHSQNPSPAKKPKKDAELSLLVKSVKSKAGKLRKP